MKNKSFILLFLLFVSCILLLTGCMIQKDVSKAREAWAERSDGEICIAVAGRMSFMKDNTHFMDGIQMAVNEINQNGGVLGKAIKIIEEDDNGQFMEGTSIAQKLADDPKISAVIGHSSSSVAIPAANIYDNAKVVMLSPIASNPKIINSDYHYIFQSIPNDNEIGRQMALYAHSKGYKKIAIFYGDSAYGKGLANPFEDTAKENDVHIIDRISGYSSKTELQRIFEKWRALDVDGIFIADSFAKGEDYINRIREAGLTVPILGSDALDANFIEALGANSEGVVLATFYNPYESGELLKAFLKKFSEIYKQDADAWAIQGYDSVKLIAYAIEYGKSQSPEKIAEVLHNIKNYQSTTGNICFDSSGKIIGKKIYKKIVQNGKFEYIKD